MRSKAKVEPVVEPVTPGKRDQDQMEIKSPSTIMLAREKSKQHTAYYQCLRVMLEHCEAWIMYIANLYQTKLALEEVRSRHQGFVKKHIKGSLIKFNEAFFPQRYDDCLSCITDNIDVLRTLHFNLLTFESKNPEERGLATHSVEAGNKGPNRKRLVKTMTLKGSEMSSGIVRTSELPTKHKAYIEQFAKQPSKPFLVQILDFYYTLKPHLETTQKSNTRSRIDKIEFHRWANQFFSMFITARVKRFLVASMQLNFFQGLTSFRQLQNSDLVPAEYQSKLAKLVTPQLTLTRLEISYKEIAVPLQEIGVLRKHKKNDNEAPGIVANLLNSGGSLNKDWRCCFLFFNFVIKFAAQTNVNINQVERCKKEVDSWLQLGNEQNREIERLAQQFESAKQEEEAKNRQWQQISYQAARESLKRQRTDRDVSEAKDYNYRYCMNVFEDLVEELGGYVEETPIPNQTLDMCIKLLNALNDRYFRLNMPQTLSLTRSITACQTKHLKVVINHQEGSTDFEYARKRLFCLPSLLEKISHDKLLLNVDEKVRHLKEYKYSSKYYISKKSRATQVAIAVVAAVVAVIAVAAVAALLAHSFGAASVFFAAIGKGLLAGKIATVTPLSIPLGVYGLFYVGDSIRRRKERREEYELYNKGMDYVKAQRSS